MSGNDGPVKIDLGAKANIKIEVKTEVPAQASGRLVNALTDAVSPITEWLGLVGDKLRIHRTLVVQEVIRRANERIAAEAVQTRPVSTKIVVPLLEYASQEEFDDNFMIDKWANLLASSAADQTVSPRFVGILHELNSRQARALLAVAEYHGKFYALEHRNLLAMLFHEILKYEGDHGRPRTGEEIVTAIRDVAHDSGATCLRVIVRQTDSGAATYAYDRSLVVRAIDRAVLKSLGLIEEHAVSLARPQDSTEVVSLEYTIVTPLGYELLQATDSLTYPWTTNDHDAE